MLLGVFERSPRRSTWVGVGAAATLLGVAAAQPAAGQADRLAWSARRSSASRGVPGRLARENAIRNPARTASTAAALMIGLALVSFVAVFAAGLKGSIDDAIDKTITGEADRLQRRRVLGHPDRRPSTRSRRSTGSRSPRRCATRRTTSRAVGQGLPHPDRPGDRRPGAPLDWKEGSQELLTDMGPNDAVIDDEVGRGQRDRRRRHVRRQDGVRQGDRLHGHRDVHRQHRLHRRLRRLRRQRRRLRRGQRVPTSSSRSSRRRRRRPCRRRSTTRLARSSRP